MYFYIKEHLISWFSTRRALEWAKDCKITRTHMYQKNIWHTKKILWLHKSIYLIAGRQNASSSITQTIRTHYFRVSMLIHPAVYICMYVLANGINCFKAQQTMWSSTVLILKNKNPDCFNQNTAWLPITETIKDTYNHGPSKCTKLLTCNPEMRTPLLLSMASATLRSILNYL